MDMLLFLGTSEDGRARSVRLLGNLVEAITFPADSMGQATRHRLGVVACEADCLEIGLGMLGRGETRTVEEGERSLSVVTIFPYRGRGKSTGPNEGDQEREALQELIGTGAVEPGAEAQTKDVPDSASEALQAAAKHDRWSIVLNVGTTLSEQTVIKRLTEDRQIQSIEPAFEDDETLLGLVAFLERRKQPLESAGDSLQVDEEQQAGEKQAYIEAWVLIRCLQQLKIE